MPLAFAGAFYLPDAFWALGLATGLFMAGWFGTERVCYVRAFRGAKFEPREVWTLTRAFVLRYVILGLVAAVFSTPFILFGFSHLLSDGPRTAFIVAGIAFSFFMDFALTFVTPALAFTTRRVRRALSIGLHMIRTEWPSNAWYVLIPPLAILVVAQALARFVEGGLGWRIVMQLIAAELGLLFKGAIAAFYLRKHEVGDNGAAYQDAPTDHMLALNSNSS